MVMTGAQPRRTLRADQLSNAAGERWQIEVVAETESTNADLLTSAHHGAAEGLVRIAHYQSSGRGRLGRTWTSPPGAGLTVSILLRPRIETARWGWLPLLAGVAVAEAIGPDARLKWPNDVLLGPQQGKVAGILVQSGPDAAVVGIGVNVSTLASELPPPGPGAPPPTSLQLTGGTSLDRGELLVRLLDRLGHYYDGWQRADGDARRSGIATAYDRLCSTLQREVSVELTGSSVQATAIAIDPDGRLVLEADGVRTLVAAGDVTHLRAVTRG